MKTSTSKSSVVTQILLAVVAIVLGYLLLFNKSVQVTTLCQILVRTGTSIASGAFVVSLMVSIIGPAQGMRHCPSMRFPCPKRRC